MIVVLHKSKRFIKMTFYKGIKLLGEDIGVNLRDGVVGIGF